MCQLEWLYFNEKLRNNISTFHVEKLISAFYVEIRVSVYVEQILFMLTTQSNNVM